MAQTKKQKDIGSASYDSHKYGTRWWHARAKDRAHQRAYRLIAEYIAGKAKKKKGRIIDFACGPGLLIKHLKQQLPGYEIVGIDESKKAIKAAEEYLPGVLSKKEMQDVMLMQHALPNFDLSVGKSDIVIFSFPDFRIDDEEKWVKRWKSVFPEDWDASKRVSKKLRKLYDDFEHADAAELFVKRVANRNLLSLTKKKGLMFRIEYSGCDRDECDPAYLDEMAWYECIKPESKRMRNPVRKRLTFARLVDSAFYKSKVILDVYEQTKDEDDKKGGFFISMFKRA